MNLSCIHRALHLAIWTSIFQLITIHAMFPQPPVHCTQTGCTLTNSYGSWPDRQTCRALNVTYPTTEEQLRSVVAYAAENKLKVKIVTKFSHSIPKLACPSSAINTILISTEQYDSDVTIDAAKLTVTADAGVPLRKLIDAVEGKGMSMVAAPYWEGVSVGGMIGTGAHGSSWWGRGGAVHDYVVGVTVVVPASKAEGFAKVVKVGINDELLNAAKVSLGVLGVISKVTLAIEPGFKRSITYNFTGDDKIEEIFTEHAKKYEFGDITWYPSKRTAVYRYDFRVPLNTDGNGVNDFIGFQSNALLVTKTIRSVEETFEKARNIDGQCMMASTIVGAKKLTANGLKNNPLFFTGYPVIGPQGKMQTSGSCLYSSSSFTSCAWDPRNKGLSFYESTAIFPATKFADYIRDIKKLRDINPQKFCGIDSYNGILIRFIKSSKAYLGQSEDSVVIDFNYLRAGDPSTPRLNQDVMEEMEQLAFLKYGAKPHWAKNRNLAFFGVKNKYVNFKKFVAAKNKLDPNAMFSSEWSDAILFGKEGLKLDGCGLEGLCICTEDKHCSPSQGLFCRPGLVYDHARVCRYEKPKINI